VFAIAILVVAMHIIGSMALKTSFWGVHAYAFFHPAWLILAAAAVLGISVTLTLRHRLAGLRSSPNAAGLKAIPQRPALIVLLAGGAALFWFARCSHTYLGDGTVLISTIPEGKAFHPREPLTMMAQSATYALGGPLFGRGVRADDLVAWDAIALGSVVAGILFIVFAWLLARELTALRTEAGGEGSPRNTVVLLVSLILLTQGYVQLFFGYVENYALYTVCVALYLWLSLRFLRGSSPMLLPACALVLGLTLHIATVILIPSFAVLSVRALSTPGKRLRALRDLIITCGLLIGIHVAFTTWQSGYSLFSTLLETAGIAVTRRQEYVPMFSSIHVRDFFNEQVLIGPLGLYLFIAALIAVFVVRTRRTMSNLFLVVAGLSFLAAGWLAGDSNLGYARDWDVWAAGGLVFTTTGIGLFLSIAGSLRAVVPALLIALVVSLFHTWPWVAVNASSARSLERLKTLPLGLGRTEVLVSQWHRRHGDQGERLRWLQRAIEVNPTNNNAHYLLGIYHKERGDVRAAAEAFHSAVEYRSDKLLFRHLLIEALTGSGEYDDALPHFEFVLEREPENAQQWVLYGNALTNAGREEEAAAAFERALPMYESMRSEAPEDYQANLTCGWLLNQLGDYENALRLYEIALQAKPDSDSALCLMGYVLRRLGREAEAVAYFKRCLEINPERPDGPGIEAWILEVTP
jgi:tetratricopeptide (TPR) repeat protein